ncbi:pimeloyl-ACP methyl ester carboxylesterase [Cryobacterium sp. CAN_C3]|nr:pimeloyl-ACP methyl ester carboxylesterase [Cryobacterium sp. CAN_C3]
MTYRITTGSSRGGTNDYRAFQAPISGGSLHGGQWRAGETIGTPVLAVHGITASHLTWPWLAEQLPGTRVIAPDLRGRARSNHLPGPYGLRQHADDLAAVLDFLEIDRAIVVGHSMGAFVAVWLAHLHPDRVQSLVLVDGGLPILREDGIDPLLMLGPAAERLSRTFASRDAYAEFWRAHPAFATDWSERVGTFANYDLDGTAPNLHPSARLEAVAENVTQLNGSDGYAEALAELCLPMDFLRAPRGLLNESTALYDRAAVDAAIERMPALRRHEVDGVNHYTIVMSDRGAGHVASVITDQLDQRTTTSSTNEQRPARPTINPEKSERTSLMMNTVFDGITQHTISTARLQAGVLERPATNPSDTVVFIHGNVSSSLFWQPLMLALPRTIRALAIDLRGFGTSETLPVDARRGLGDFADDVASVLTELGIDRAHFVGWSMGGGVLMQFLLDHPAQVSTVTLVAPVSPYGFGGTRGAEGVRLTPDDAGAGAGGANPDFIARLASGDRTADAQTCPRTVYQTAYVKPPFSSEFDDVWVESMLTTATGPGSYPGDASASANWPGFAPGTNGVLNTMVPRYFNTSAIVDLADKPPILWVHGSDDVIVSDTSLFDLNFLGQLGVIPGWPGLDAAPPQPMIQQTRAVLAAYEQGGGDTTELELVDCGHSPHLEHPAAFLEALLAQFDRAVEQSATQPISPDQITL